MRDYSALQEAGNRAGLEKLRENEHKAGFDNINIHYAHKRILQEARELGDEIYNQELWPKRKEPRRKEDIDFAAARHEAADIRNFCDMIIQACDKELKQ